MLLRHKKYPAAQINLPIGGALVFDNFECLILPQTIIVVGPEFFESLVERNVVSIIGKETVQEFYEKAIGVSVKNSKVSAEEAIDVTNLEDTEEEKDDIKDEQPEAPKKKVAKKTGKKK